ncbi:MAG: amino acid ABC transporter permease [Gammaproteobacteria bacterium]|nr:amino acid ABC transporter permease [Gammaproteobacteria bacterium]
MKTNYQYLRTEEAPILPPPATQSGIMGWLWQNMFSSMVQFHNVGAAIRSLLMIALTVVLAYAGFNTIVSLVQFAFIDAVWSDPDGLKRGVCTTVDQGGIATSQVGACWPYVGAKFKTIVYGAYPTEELWRVDIVFALLAVGIVWLVLENTPGRKLVGISMLTVFPVIALILLTGGHFEIEAQTFVIMAIVGLGGVALWVLGRNGGLGAFIEAFSAMFLLAGVTSLALLVAAFATSIDFGLVEVETSLWGGLLVTLVVALTGIAASLPLGVLFALGRRSEMPLIRYLSVGFIEFWRGVPLITVLFMSSVMLPMFLPGTEYQVDELGQTVLDAEGKPVILSEGWDFDKLLRALIGVALFSAAYMAEVIRGGLQAIPKGQYEGAMALGLSYGQMTQLIVLPQALKIVIPGIVNTFIGLFKDTTLVLIIGIFDLLGAIQSSFTDSSWATPTTNATGYLVCALIFFVFCFGMSRYSVYLEHKLDTGHKS